MSNNMSSIPTNDQNAWKEKVIRELKKQQFDEKFEDKIENIIIKIEDGLNSVDSSTITTTNNGTNEWQISASIDVTAEKENNKKLLEVLTNGADTLFIYPTKTNHDWDVLFNEIEFEYIVTHVQIKHMACLNSLQRWFTNQTNFFVVIDFLTINETSEALAIISKSNIPIKIKIDGFSLQQCGANSQQEMAFICDQLHETILILPEQNKFQFQLNMGVGNNFMLEIAKFRTLKGLVNTVLKSYNYPLNSFELIAEIGWTNKSLKDPHTNQLRQTTEAISAVIGGIDILQIHPYDQRSIHGSTSFSQRMALNISSILKEESYLKLVKDAYRGSNYIENLSDRMGDSAWRLFKQLTSMPELNSKEKKIFIIAMVGEIVELRKLYFAQKQLKLIGLNVFENSSPTDNAWQKENLFLGMSFFRYEKISSNE